MQNKWYDLDKVKPANDEQLVLCFHPRMGDDGDGRILLGRYSKHFDCIRPEMSFGFNDVRFWMPLPKFPRSKRLRLPPAIRKELTETE